MKSLKGLLRFSNHVSKPLKRGTKYHKFPRKPYPSISSSSLPKPQTQAPLSDSQTLLLLPLLQTNETNKIKNHTHTPQNSLKLIIHSPKNGIDNSQNIRIATEKKPIPTDLQLPIPLSLSELSLLLSPKSVISHPQTLLLSQNHHSTQRQ